MFKIIQSVQSICLNHLSLNGLLCISIMCIGGTIGCDDDSQAQDPSDNMMIIGGEGGAAGEQQQGATGSPGKPIVGRKKSASIDAVPMYIPPHATAFEA